MIFHMVTAKREHHELGRQINDLKGIVNGPWVYKNLREGCNPERWYDQNTALVTGWTFQHLDWWVGYSQHWYRVFAAQPNIYMNTNYLSQCWYPIMIMNNQWYLTTDSLMLPAVEMSATYVCVFKTYSQLSFEIQWHPPTALCLMTCQWIIHSHLKTMFLGHNDQQVAMFAMMNHDC